MLQPLNVPREVSVVTLMREDGFVLRRESMSGEYSTACPKCGGRDRFRLWEMRRGKSRFWCRECGIRGDVADYLQMVRGMSVKDSLRAIGTPALRTEVAPQRTWTQQPAQWHTMANDVVLRAHHTLVNTPTMLDALAARRGIEPETVERFRLGLVRVPSIQMRSAWGLDTTERERFTIPKGLMIPGTDSAGRIVRIRLRCPASNGKRYWMIPGSCATPLVIRRGSPRLWIIVESELDGVLLTQILGNQVGIMALGSAWVRAGGSSEAILRDADRLLVALDADEAGDKASSWWLERYPAARRLRPTRKDPGDMWKAGESLTSWIEAGT